MEKTTIYGQRLAAWRKTANLTQRGLSTALGISQGYISNIESGTSEPSRNFLQALSEHFQVNPAWILEGREPMVFDTLPGFAAGTDEAVRITPANLAHPSSGDFAYDNEEFTLVKRYDVNLSAGPGLIPIEDALSEHLAFSRSWLRREGINSQLCGLVRVRGDSMAPTIPDGAMVLIHMPEMTVLQEGIFAFSRAGSAFIKRIIPAGIEQDGRATSLVILSDNPAYPAESVSGKILNEIRIVGRVRSVMFSV